MPRTPKNQYVTLVIATFQIATTSKNIQHHVIFINKAELAQLAIDAPLLSLTQAGYPLKVQDCAGWNATDLSHGYAAF
jgi:hypothetical protein